VTFAIREVRPDEHHELGELIAQAYLALGDDGAPDGYDDDLRDVAGRAALCPVLVAVDDDGRVLGGATFVLDAQRLYLGLGFERDPEVDWRPAPNVDLRAYRYDLRRAT
jgi:hypothetical protein